MEIVNLNCSEVFADEDFNCRGYIPDSDVYDLAMNIKANGLQQPIGVQPYDKKSGFKYRIIHGHRRFISVSRILKLEIVPSIILENLSEADAIALNLGENVQRKSLNILQEAKSLRQLRDAGIGINAAAKQLRVQHSWVQTRYNVLDFPEDIQEEIVKGTLNQFQINEVHALPVSQWYNAVRQIKESKAKGERTVNIKKMQPAKPARMLKAKIRSPHETEIMLHHLMGNCQGELFTRTLAWTIGNVTTLELLQEFKDWCDANGYHYNIPTEGIPGL